MQVLDTPSLTASLTSTVAGVTWDAPVAMPTPDMALAPQPDLPDSADVEAFAQQLLQQVEAGEIQTRQAAAPPPLAPPPPAPPRPGAKEPTRFAAMAHLAIAVYTPEVLLGLNGTSRAAQDILVQLYDATDSTFATLGTPLRSPKQSRPGQNFLGQVTGRILDLRA